MGKRYVLMRGVDQYYNFSQHSWVGDAINGDATLWSNHDDLLTTVKQLVDNNIIDKNDSTMKIMEVGFIYGKQNKGMTVADFIQKKCEADLVKSAKAKLDQDELDALTKEFQRGTWKNVLS